MLYNQNFTMTLFKKTKHIRKIYRVRTILSNKCSISGLQKIIRQKYFRNNINLIHLYKVYIVCFSILINERTSMFTFLSQETRV